MNSDAKRALATFAQELADLRRDCGDLSFPEMEILSKNSDRGRLPRSTASDAIRGKRLPKVKVVINFVVCCREHAHAVGVEVDANRFDTVTWTDRWTEVSRLCDQKPRPNPVIKETVAPSAGEETDETPSSTAGGDTTGTEPPTAGDDTTGTESPPSRHRLLNAVTSTPTSGGMWLPDRHRSAYLLIGAGERPGLPDVPPLPWVSRNVAHLHHALRATAPWLPVTTLLDPTAQEADYVLRTVGQAADDMLIVHLLGHGFVDDHVRLRLLTADSNLNDISRSSVDVASMLENLRQWSPAAIVLIIDTCFAGMAISNLTSLEGLGSNTYIIAATGPDGLAFDAPNSLTGTLASVLENGVSDCAYPMLITAHLARACARSFAQENDPMLARQVITTWSQGNADKILLATNFAGPDALGPAQPVLAIAR